MSDTADVVGSILSHVVCGGLSRRMFTCEIYFKHDTVYRSLEGAVEMWSGD